MSLAHEGDFDLLALRRKYRAGEITRGEVREPCVRAGRALRAIRDALVECDIEEVILRGGETIAVFRSGLRMVWESEGFGDCVSISFSEGAYEPEELALLGAMAEGKSVFLDVGANVGWFSLNLAARMDARRRRVVAFEPVAATAALLRRNIALNGLEAVVTAVEAGVADQDGQGEFHVPVDVAGAASLQHLGLDRETRLEKVALVSLDSYAARSGLGRIDLIKGDVEGAELMLVKGALGLIGRDRPILMLELLRKWSRAFGYHPDAVLDLLRPHGYACFAIGKGPPRRIEAIAEDTAETNFLFLAEGHAKERALVEGRA
jgi:FkbM family methyltransferase